MTRTQKRIAKLLGVGAVIATLATLALAWRSSDSPRELPIAFIEFTNGKNGEKFARFAVSNICPFAIEFAPSTDFTSSGGRFDRSARLPALSETAFSIRVPTNGSRWQVVLSHHKVPTKTDDAMFFVRRFFIRAHLDAVATALRTPNAKGLEHFSYGPEMEL
jgi:hypothetical protein